MMKTLLSALLVVLGVGVSTFTQQPLAPGPGTNVKMERSSGPPGAKTSVAISLAPVPGVQVAQLNLSIAYAKSQLTYVSFETSGAADEVDADVKVSTRPREKDPAQTELSLVISTLTGKATRKPLPNGTVLYMIFQIAKDVKLGVNLPFEITGTALTAGNPPQPVQPLTVQAAKLLVSETPVTSCFFYMH